MMALLLAFSPMVALSANPLDAAQAAVTAERYADAQRLLQTHLDQYPNDLEARFLLARVLSWQRSFEPAVSLYQDLLKKKPGNADYQFGLAQTHVWRGAPADALPLLASARRLTANYQAVWQLQIATLEQVGGPTNMLLAAQLRKEAGMRFADLDWVAPPAVQPAPAPDNPQTQNAITPPPWFSAKLIPFVEPLAATKKTIEVIVSADQLSNGRSNWQGVELRLTHQIAARHLVAISVRESHRFKLNDNQIEINYALPLTARLTGIFDVSASPSHQVLARSSLGATLQYEFAPAWLIHVGAKHTAYNDVSVNQGTLMLEHYFSAFRWAAAWHPTRAFGTTDNSGELRFDYYYDDVNRIGIVLAAGQEAVNVNGAGVLQANVRSLVLNAHHWFRKDWGVSYEIGTTRQGDFYTQNGIRVGVRHAY